MESKISNHSSYIKIFIGRTSSQIISILSLWFKARMLESWQTNLINEARLCPQDPNTGFMTNTPLEVFTITPGRRYRFRLINSFGSVCPSQITFEGHSLTIIATDGEAVQPVTVDTIISFSGKEEPSSPSASIFFQTFIKIDEKRKGEGGHVFFYSRHQSIQLRVGKISPRYLKT